MRPLYTFLFLLLLQIPLVLTAQPANTEVIAKRLLEKMNEQPQDYLSVHLVLADQVDLQALDVQLTAARSSLAQRAETVISALKEKAQATQGEFISLLTGHPSVEAGSISTYWVANVIFAKMKAVAVAELSRHSGVAWIGLNGKLELNGFEKTQAPPFMAPNSAEQGLKVINAPALWAMGYTGYGKVAFTNDTGVDPTHPALLSRYRGHYVPKKETWFALDHVTHLPSTNYTPYDCQEHGTHVTGTIMGLDRLNNDTIGVAFNAQWIGAAVLCGIGTEDNVAAFQWSLDPDEDPSTTDDMPDVINNSWYDPSLTTEDCYSVYVAIEEAMETAGIAVVFSAGNEGPDSKTITPPHNINLNLVSAFTVGALNGNQSSLPIASFSSRGPSKCEATDSSLVIKPEVSAPGVSVRSCVPGNRYDLFNGTSMAAPHVSGAILLLKEAFPYLTGKELKLALYFTCTDLGDPGEDNVYGMGVINVLAAFNYLVDQGNVPVSPYRENDVMLIDVKTPPQFCELSVDPQITVENAGTATLTSFDVVYRIGNFSKTYSWTGTLAPKERSQFSLPGLETPPGSYELKIELTQPNGVEDERPLNNILIIPVRVTSRPHLLVKAEGDNTICEGSSALLRAEYHGPGSMHVDWYDAAFGGNLVGEGSVFETPVLMEPATFYAEGAYFLPVGLENKSAGDNELSEINEQGMVFNVLVPAKLKSAKVYAEKKGLRIFQLTDKNGEVIKQGILNVAQAGEFRVQFNWDLPVQDGMTLRKSGGSPLYLNTSGATYPYLLDNVIRITGTTDEASANGAWYFFYDWEIEIGEPCGRKGVSLEVQPAGNQPLAQFSASTDSVNLDNNEPVQFFNSSTGSITSYHWNFGDGNTSEEAEPIHFFETPGIFTVSLTVTNAEGCTDFSLATITVGTSAVSSTHNATPASDYAEVFPNPVTDVISVHFDLTIAQPLKIHLTNLTGQMLWSRNFVAAQKDVLQIEATDLAPGIYFLILEMDARRSVWKVVKI